MKDRLEKRIENGSVVILDNPRHEAESVAIGQGTSVKINANLGTSPDCDDVNLELNKARAAVEYGADTLMDLSIGQNVDETRRRILKETNVPVGSVPVYQAFLEDKVDADEEDFLKAIEKHCKDGVDFVTLHCGVTWDLVDKLDERLISVTSRGGSFLAAWMIHNQKENPLYENFDQVLDILEEYNVVISLGDGLRPACLNDATDELQLRELFTLGNLTERAWERNVGVIIEGPGHIPLNEVQMNVELEKKICHNAPFYVLGPLVTDSAVGYDHMAGAIGGALAGYYGADFLCYVTPAEHLGLPGLEDVKQGVIASKIAAHAADVARGDKQEDHRLSKARKELDWDTLFEMSPDPMVREKYEKQVKEKECSMCGEYCALNIVREYVNKD